MSSFRVSFGSLDLVVLGLLFSSSFDVFGPSLAIIGFVLEFWLAADFSGVAFSGLVTPDSDLLGCEVFPLGSTGMD